jgi:hypothetical protein
MRAASVNIKKSGSDHTIECSDINGADETKSSIAEAVASR